jgi:hypothetical protein
MVGAIKAMNGSLWVNSFLYRDRSKLSLVIELNLLAASGEYSILWGELIAGVRGDLPGDTADTDAFKSSGNRLGSVTHLSCRW